MNFAALILAAGSSRRMGGVNKLLLDLNGRPLVRHVLAAVRASGVSRICVVLGHEARLVHAVLADGGSGNMNFAVNAEHEAGLASSLVCGLTALRRAGGHHDGIAVCLGDMPFVDGAVIDMLCSSLRPGDYAAVPAWQGQWGHPVLLSAGAAGDAMTLTGDRGARSLLLAHREQVREVPAHSGAVLCDIDRPADLRLS